MTERASRRELAEFRAHARRLEHEEARARGAGLRAGLKRLGAPLLAARDARRFVRQHGAAVHAAEGVAPWRQASQFWWLRLRYRVTARNYLDYQLYRPERRARAGAYLMWPDFRRLTRAISAAHGPASDLPRLRDKRQFAAWCAEHGLPTPALLAEWHDGALVFHAMPDGELPACDLFSKPPDMSHGFGTARWRFDGAGGWAGRDGAVRTADALRAELARTSQTLPRKFGQTPRRIILMPCLRNHPVLAPIAPGALSTVRVVTYRAPAAPSELLIATCRLAVGDAPADNFHFGGIIAPVDAETGRLGVALRREGRWLAPVTHHPDTGAEIAGRALPDWGAAVALARRAHDALRGVPVVGWDVALTPEGPVLVEGNTQSNLDLLQAPADRPLGDTPLVPALLAHARAVGR